MSVLNWTSFLEKLVGEKPISNIGSYIGGMNLSIEDKLFFVDLIDFDAIVDFGCADGTFLYEMSKIRPDVKIIAYDIDTEMLKKAESKLGRKSLVTDDWNEVRKSLVNYKKPLLNLSSVIHEVYSYSSGSQVKYFWDNQVFGGDFKSIAIRDMIPSTEISKSEISQFKDDVRKVRQKFDKSYLKSFEERWGSINENYKNLIHFLLKYRFTDNWEREVAENYLPLSIETLRKKVQSGYRITYEDNFILPFLKTSVKRDFNIDLAHPTHTKMIISNKNFRK
jgi:SAM-dependent methyltransferase